ncbi:hypothetical protein [Streptomyces sp. enrichment culture]|uniref:hypothetical protein n=1 Tax=Streptomyces sp. enrichment culture TaxID=1795815 RepID=UPI003F553222
MSADRTGPAARLPLRAGAVLAALAAVLLTLALGFTDGARLVPSPSAQGLAAPGAPQPPGPRATVVPGPPSALPAPVLPAPVLPVPAPPSPAFHPADTRPYTDDAYIGTATLLVRPQRDAGERTVPAGPLLFTPAHTPRVPPRPARPAPVSGHVPAGTAHVPSDLGRAPPTASST